MGVPSWQLVVFSFCPYKQYWMQLFVLLIFIYFGCTGSYLWRTGSSVAAFGIWLLALGVQSLSHWTTSPDSLFLYEYVYRINSSERNHYIKRYVILNLGESVLSRVQLFATLWAVAHQAPPSMGFSRQDCHFLLQGIFLTQGLNPGLPHCRQML